jgi:hypothetical protein
MRTYIAAAALSLSATTAQAVCPGSVVSSGITLAAGASQTVWVRNAALGCANVGNVATIIVNPSRLATVTAGVNNGPAFVVNGSTPGTGTLSVSAPTFSQITVPLTVSAGTLDLDTQ